MKINKIYLIVFVFLSIKYNTCISQQFKSTSNTDEPIEIYADNGIEWHKNSKKYVALGNAQAVSGSLSLKSDKIEAYYNETKDSSMDIANVIAKKNVVIQDKKMKIIGGNFAEYNVKKDYFKVNGSRLKLTSQKNILRSTAKIGDSIFITGPLGEGRKGLADWNRKEKSQYVKKFFYPEIPFKKSEYISKYATSCIDISDGLIKDLGSICKKSGVGAEIIFENIPITNDIDDLSYGDDYKLCYTCSPNKIDNELISRDHLIGKITSQKEIIVKKENLIFDLKKSGWDSFV